MPTYDGTSHMIGNTGDGYAKITFYGYDNESIKVKTSFDYTYTGNYQQYAISVTGYYRIEVWGAQVVGQLQIHQVMHQCQHMMAHQL
jgi:predicted oxidoreductase (fatty acid repression mutant protein)